MTNRWRMTTAGLGVFALLTMAVPASASPADEARATAQSIAKQRLQLITDAERINERRLATTAELDRLVREEQQLGVQVGENDAEMQQLHTEASNFIVQAYIAGSDASPISAIASAPDANAIPLREGYSSVLLGSSADVVDQIRATRQDTAARASRLRTLANQRIALQQSLTADQVRIDKAEVDLAELARTTDAKIITLVQEEQDRLRAEAARKAAEAAASRPTPPAITVSPATVAPKRTAQSGNSTRTAAPKTAVPVTTTTAAARSTTTTARQAPTSVRQPRVVATAATTVATRPAEAGAANPAATQPATTRPTTPRTTQPVPTTIEAPRPAAPPPSSKAAIAVAEALRHLGKRYVFGAAGPNTFDCSGLTQWAWAKAGVAMDHYTGAQFNAFPRVSLNELQPGDLIFFRVDLGHMGMYIGNGQFIHAPHTGDVVRIASMAGARVVGAVRPG